MNCFLARFKKDVAAVETAMASLPAESEQMGDFDQTEKENDTETEQLSHVHNHEHSVEPFQAAAATLRASKKLIKVAGKGRTPGGQKPGPLPAVQQRSNTGPTEPRKADVGAEVQVLSEAVDQTPAAEERKAPAQAPLAADKTEEELPWEQADPKHSDKQPLSSHERSEDGQAAAPEQDQQQAEAEEKLGEKRLRVDSTITLIEKLHTERKRAKRELATATAKYDQACLAFAKEKK